MARAVRQIGQQVFSPRRAADSFWCVDRIVRVLRQASNADAADQGRPTPRARASMEPSTKASKPVRLELILLRYRTVRG